MEKEENAYSFSCENDLNSDIAEDPEELLEDARDVSTRYQSTSELSCWGLMDAEFEEVKFGIWGK